MPSKVVVDIPHVVEFSHNKMWSYPEGPQRGFMPSASRFHLFTLTLRSEISAVGCVYESSVAPPACSRQALLGSALFCLGPEFILLTY